MTITPIEAAAKVERAWRYMRHALMTEELNEEEAMALYDAGLVLDAMRVAIENEAQETARQFYSDTITNARQFYDAYLRPMRKKL